MNDLRRRLVLGVDAGGTKTTALIALVSNSAPANVGDTNLKVLGRGDAGAGNPTRSDYDTAFNNVTDAMHMASTQAGVAFDDIDVAVAGMAGVGTESTQNEATQYLQRQTQIDDLRVVPDYKLVLPSAFPRDDGIAVIAGTGSIVHGIRGEIEKRVGGRGYLVDDAGSGFWIGRQALCAMVYSVDGRGPKTTLTQIVCQAFDRDDPSQLVVMIHALPERLRVIASITPLVVNAAIEGDAIANDILDRAASELTSMISVACRSLGFSQAGYSLALAGSVLTKTAVVREKLADVLQRETLAPKSTQTVVEPVFGAIQLAALEP